MDFGMYTGLQRKSNIFETKAANRQMEMQIAATREQRAQEDLNKDTEIDVAMQEYFNSISQLDVLDQDKERIKAEEMTLRMDVIDKVRQYNGNLQNFAFGGGAATMEKYKNNVMESESVQNAIANKTNYAQWQHAQANGLFVKDVSVEVPYYNEETGEIEKRKEVVGMDKAYEMFEKGQIGKIPYDGAEKDIDIGPEFFQKIFKDTANPYSTDNKVTANDVYLTVRENGGSHDQATTKMKKYEELIANGATTWTYRMLDPLDQQIKQEQLRNMRAQRRAANATASGGTEKQRILSPTARLQQIQWSKGEENPPSVVPIDAEIDHIKKALGLIYDKDLKGFMPTKSLEVTDKYVKGKNDKPRTYDLQQFDTVEPLEFQMSPDGTLLMGFQVTYQDDGSNSANPVTENWIGNDKYSSGAHINNWRRPDGDGWGDDVWQGTVYAPVAKYFEGWQGAQVDADANLTNKLINYPAEGMITSSQIAQQGAERINTTFDYLMNAVGMSYEEAQAWATGISDYENTESDAPNQVSQEQFQSQNMYHNR